MTNMNIDPVEARLQRLYFRAQDLHKATARLAEDLNDEDEGEGHAHNAAIALGSVEHKLMEKMKAVHRA